MTYARRTDTTQAAIVDALRDVGAQVLILGGAIDLLVWYQGEVYPMDPKSPGGTLTATQKRLVAQGWPVKLPRTVEEALDAIGVRRE